MFIWPGREGAGSFFKFLEVPFSALSKPIFAIKGLFVEFWKMYKIDALLQSNCFSLRFFVLLSKISSLWDFNFCNAPNLHLWYTSLGICSFSHHVVNNSAIFIYFWKLKFAEISPIIFRRNFQGVSQELREITDNCCKSQTIPGNQCVLQKYVGVSEKN